MQVWDSLFKFTIFLLVIGGMLGVLFKNNLYFAFSPVLDLLSYGVISPHLDYIKISITTITIYFHKLCTILR